ncbi:MAG: helix-turn-helix domain-containing protein [Emcibacteraceae bacterium]|nr:helix-turn-helix domain-containing protein [Emcibacteraceae bacterium]MDG1995683.1 helix-turn-helix domain-containing protein [Emcibacteraceae bacterium]
MNNKYNKIDQLAEKYLTYWSKTDIDGLMSMYSKRMKYYDMPSGELVEYGDLREYIKDTFDLFQNYSLKLNQSIVIEGNSAFIYWTQSFVSADTGRNVKVNGVELIVFDGDLIKSIHEFYEFQTTGSVLMPSPGTDSYIEKMTKLGLTKEMMDNISDELSKYIKNDRPYLEPDLTLLTVADHLGYTRNQISFVINHSLGTSFYDLINGHRIDHAVMKMKAPDNNLSILELGFDAGFNSVSGFYNAFKKQTEKTPAQFLRHLKK